MIVHNFDPILIDLGLIQIRWYSLAYIFGIILGWIYAIKIIKFTQQNKYNFKQISLSNFNDLLTYIVLGIIIGGRIGYVIFYNFEYYSQNILEILKIWHGGMSFHGGLIGVIVSIYLFAKKEKINFFKISDIISCVAPLGIFLGRIANFINGELYGKTTDIWWAVIFPKVDQLGRHPSQIYEAILEGVILMFLINFLAIKKKLLFKPGYISGYFLILYSVMRIISEYFREPDLHIGYVFGYFSMGILLSFITIFFGLIIIKRKKNE